MRTDIISINCENEALSYYERRSEENDIDIFLSQYENEKNNFIQKKIESISKNKESYLNKAIYDIEDDYIDNLKINSCDNNVYNFIISKLNFNEKMMARKIIPSTIVCTIISLLTYFVFFPKTDYILFCAIMILFPLSFFHVYMSAYKMILKGDKYNKIFIQTLNNNTIINLFYEYFMSSHNINENQMKLLKKIINIEEYTEILYKCGPNLKYKFVIPIIMRYKDEINNNNTRKNILTFYNNI